MKRIIPIFLFASLLALSACGDKADEATSSESAQSSEASETGEQSSQLVAVDSLPDGIAPIEDYASVYPAHVKSFEQNAEMEKTTYGGSVPVDYLEEHPYLNAMYEGYVFAVQYDRARGHVYALEDVTNTNRPKLGASCLSCKVSQFEEMLAEDPTTSSKDFDEVRSEITVGFTCYDCHGATPGQMNPNRAHLANTLEKNADQYEGHFSDKELTCAQCHVEYYMDKETKDVVLPWDNGLSAEGAFEYYEKARFFDWEHPRTGAQLLKVQHPETETFDGSFHDMAGMDCMSCHMPSTEVDGETIHSHHWTSPLKTPEQSCLTCHSGDTAESIVAKAEALQKPIVEETEEVGQALEEFIDALAYAVENVNYSDDAFRELREIHREAQFYFDYVFVENSEGFHNPTKARENLQHAKDLIEKGMELLEQ